MRHAPIQGGASGSLRYVQSVRGRWGDRILAPEELRDIPGGNDLVRIGLPDNIRARKKEALRIIKAYLAQNDGAREVWDVLREAVMPRLRNSA